MILHTSLTVDAVASNHMVHVTLWPIGFYHEAVKAWMQSLMLQVTGER